MNNTHITAVSATLQAWLAYSVSSESLCFLEMSSFALRLNFCSSHGCGDGIIGRVTVSEKTSPGLFSWSRSTEPQQALNTSSV